MSSFSFLVHCTHRVEEARPAVVRETSLPPKVESEPRVSVLTRDTRPKPQPMQQVLFELACCSNSLISYDDVAVKFLCYPLMRLQAYFRKPSGNGSSMDRPTSHLHSHFAPTFAIATTPTHTHTDKPLIKLPHLTHPHSYSPLPPPLHPHHSRRLCGSAPR